MTNNYPNAVFCQSNENSAAALNIEIAGTPEEKKAIYHFRYQIYVEEMSKQIRKLDKSNKLLYDDLDEWGILLFIKIGSEIIATARINIGRITDFPREEVDFLSLKKFQNCPNHGDDHQFALVTKVMVAPQYRSSRAFYQLFEKCYDLCCLYGVDFMFGLCNFHLIRLYEKLGTHRYGNNFFLPGYGLQTPLVLLINDIQYLRKTGSPLFRRARKRAAVDGRAVEWFHTNFTNQLSIINSQIISEEDLWTVLSERLSASPMESMTILSHLSVTEAKKFFHSCGSYVRCGLGDLITNQGDVSYTYNILISGKLKSLTILQPVKEYNVPGQSFGVNGLTEHNYHTEDIEALDSTDVLVLSGIAFQKFSHKYPEIAAKVIQSIKDARNKRHTG